LLTEFTDNVRTSGARRIWLEVDRDAGPAVELYRLAGFIESDRPTAGRQTTMMLDLRDGSADD
jgi:ribosomal protein S18 acetylase RimI-like enzyme